MGVTAALLLNAGALHALQSMTLIAALPFCFIMLLLCAGLWRGMAVDRLHFARGLTSSSQAWNGQQWQRRLDQILHQPKASDIAQFISHTAAPALEKVAAELRLRHLQADVIHLNDGAIKLEVRQDSLRNFVYGVQIVTSAVPALALRDASLPASSRPQTHIPETFFADGRKGYDVQYLSEHEMLADILRQYERHLSLAMDTRTHLYAKAPQHELPSEQDEAS